MKKALSLNIFISAVLMMILGACSRPDSHTPSYPDPEKFEIRGLDISGHNGDIDFDKVKSQGYEFVIIKATEGSTFRDKKFVENVRRAREAGLKVGAYHFFRFDSPGYIQGLNFASALRDRGLDLPAVIDLEEWTNPNMQATPLVMQRLGDMIDHLEQRGHRVMLYTNKNGYNRFLKSYSRSLPLWICSLASEPVDIRWTLWQATHSGKVDGVDHPVDINAFAGTRSDWEAFIAGDGEKR